MDERLLVKRSKLISLVLRHQPEVAGLTLDAGGWVAVDDLLAGLRAHVGVALSRLELDEIVAKNNKRRFAYDGTGARIRASQGQSVEVDLGLAPAQPPETLYHGTGSRAVPIIQAEGLRKMRRQHVHLSPDIETARKVGARHGVPAIFRVAAGAMARDAAIFYLSENGVWLVESVPPRYLALLAPDQTR